MERLAASLPGVEQDEILIDAPSQTREIEFRVMIRTAPGRFRPLKEVSPVVRALAVEQFDDQVKRVRIYVHPRLVAQKEGIVEQFVAQNS